MPFLSRCVEAHRAQAQELATAALAREAALAGRAYPSSSDVRKRGVARSLPGTRRFAVCFRQSEVGLRPRWLWRRSGVLPVPPRCPGGPPGVPTRRSKPGRVEVGATGRRRSAAPAQAGRTTRPRRPGGRLRPRARPGTGGLSVARCSPPGGPRQAVQGEAEWTQVGEALRGRALQTLGAAWGTQALGSRRIAGQGEELGQKLPSRTQIWPKQAVSLHGHTLYAKNTANK
ncbi:uncharacterized protein LOC106734702 [Tupaia chinensis]|uniref:uncharacterized protein LOC106734702 n=1 Tax=Tupaia chinensis TaxID=246437 RepID=UPI000FFB7BD8|nr:uncharacterized protein LOC106734702 [Tupaia chinensis]